MVRGNEGWEVDNSPGSQQANRNATATIMAGICSGSREADRWMEYRSGKEGASRAMMMSQSIRRPGLLKREMAMVQYQQRDCAPCGRAIASTTLQPQIAARWRAPVESLRRLTGPERLPGSAVLNVAAGCGGEAAGPREMEREAETRLELDERE